MTDLWATIPDMQDWPAVSDWVEDRLRLIRQNDFTRGGHAPLAAVSCPSVPSYSVLGPYASSDWRRFALGTFLADWACYTAPADRAEFARLLSVVATFPQGFRLYFSTLNNGEAVPVGYTGWYPVSDNVYELMAETPGHIKHRGMISPLKTMALAGNYIYLFNYSIIAPFYKTDQSRALLQDFANSLTAVPYKGLCTTTVSEDGARVAQRFGMRYTGDITHDGEREAAYCLSV